MQKSIFTMIKPLSISIAISICSFSTTSVYSSELTAPRTVFQEYQGEISPKLNFSQAQTGDIYIAYRINNSGPYYFYSPEHGFSAEPSVYDSIDSYTGEIELPTFDTVNIPEGKYQFYHLMVKSGKSVLDFNNWIGGFDALKQLNFSVGYSDEINGDWNKDGFHDDDHNKDGFHDDDLNNDGYHDGDQDNDGYHDDDQDKDGYHDDDSDKDGNHDDDSNHDNNSDSDSDSEGDNDSTNDDDDW